MFRPSLRSSFKLVNRNTSTALLYSRLTAFRYLSTDARAKIEQTVKANPVVLFMKGTPAEPQCGFSRAVVQILDLHGVPTEKLKTYNVLADAELRSGIKEYSEWPTVPQIFVNGEFVGGCDILIGMHQSGELETLLENNGVIPKIEIVSATETVPEAAASPPAEDTPPATESVPEAATSPPAEDTPQSEPAAKLETFDTKV